jgi:hypothetical protein
MTPNNASERTVKHSGPHRARNGLRAHRCGMGARPAAQLGR